MIERPRDLFDREPEWAALSRLVEGARPGVTLGIVYGRRRQGKSWLLRRLVAKAGGLHHQALEEGRGEALARLGDALASERDLGAGRLGLRDWLDALRVALGLDGATAPTRSRVVVLDELPYLVAHSPELPSAIQSVVDAEATRRAPRTVLVLCGSALSIMTSLLGAGRPLHGRARLELVVKPFDFRKARAFWGVKDLEVAFLLHAILGGTPGHRALLDRPPRSARGLAAWLSEGVLDPGHALFREPEYLLSEDPRITDRALYHSMLDAISRGECTPTRIASRMGRPEGALRHPLRLLEEAELVHRAEDVLRERNPVLAVADPLVRFHHLVTRPRLSMIEEGRAVDAFEDARPAFVSGILGPHFEQLARAWVAKFASEATLGGPAGAVGPTTVNDPGSRSQLQLDVVALAAGDRRNERPKVRAIGEAKATNRPRGIEDVRRLERARELVTASGRGDATGARLLLFSRTGFSEGLRAEADRRGDLELVDLERLYEGA